MRVARLVQGVVVGYFLMSNCQALEFRHSEQWLGNGARQLADFDGDGDLDMFLGSGDFLYNNGKGRFYPHTVRGARPVGERYALADFSGDGVADIVIYSNGALLLWENDGHGNFRQQAKQLAALIDVDALVAGDFDGDGSLDVLVHSPANTDAFEILLNDGSGAFQTRIIANPGGNPLAIDTGRLDDNTSLDFTACYSDGCRLFFNQGAEGFTVSPQKLGAAGTRRALIGKLDSDAYADIYLVNYQDAAGNNLVDEIWLNDGQGGFVLSKHEFEALASIDGVIGDIDNNGDDDILVLHSAGQAQGAGAAASFTVYYNKSGLFLRTTADYSFTSGAITGGAGLYDVDGDGHLDVSLESVNAGLVLINRGDDGFSDTGQHLFAPGSGVVAADFNRDGGIDIAVVGPGAGLLLRNDGQGIFSADVGAGLIADMAKVAATDSNGDGFVDLITAGGSLHFLANDGKGSFSNTDTMGLDGAVAVVSGSFTDDSAPDLAVVDQQDIYFYVNDGLGNYVRSAAIAGVARNIALGRLNGDTFDDVVISYGADAADTYTRIFFANGDGTFRESAQHLADDASTAVAIGDLNGDGAADLFVTYASGSEVWLNDGAGNFSKHGQQTAIDAGAGDVVLVDLDHDNDLDAVVAGGKHVWLNDGNAEFSYAPAIASQTSCNKLAAADFDGDGDVDVLCSGANRGELWLNREFDTLPADAGGDAGQKSTAKSDSGGLGALGWWFGFLLMPVVLRRLRLRA